MEQSIEIAVRAGVRLLTKTQQPNEEGIEIRCNGPGTLTVGPDTTLLLGTVKPTVGRISTEGVAVHGQLTADVEVNGVCPADLTPEGNQLTILSGVGCRVHSTAVAQNWGNPSGGSAYSMTCEHWSQIRTSIVALCGVSQVSGGASNIGCRMNPDT